MVFCYDQSLAIHTRELVDNTTALLQLHLSPRPINYELVISSSVYFMMTSSNGDIFRVTGLLCGEFTGEFPSQRPVTRNFDVFIDLYLNKRLTKQSRRWWFETLSRPLWRHCNVDARTRTQQMYVTREGYFYFETMLYYGMCFVNSSRPNDAYMCQQTKPSLIQIR